MGKQQVRILKKFRIARYHITTKKLKKNSLTFVAVSDLHNVVFGEQNRNILDAIKKEKPDCILIAGDLVLGKKGATLEPAWNFLRQATEIAPVYYGLGNHEQRMKLYPEIYGREYRIFEKKIQKLGVHLLENRTESMKIRGEEIAVTGLALPYTYYSKGGKKEPLSVRDLNRRIGRAAEEKFQILLAHTPRFTDSYLKWGADLALSGHYHGGMVQIPGIGGVISPDWRLFPPYCKGKFEKEGKTAVVSAGLGEHTIPLRVFNPREFLVLTCTPEMQTEKGDKNEQK